jgi:hypothetical protein
MIVPSHPVVEAQKLSSVTVLTDESLDFKLMANLVIILGFADLDVVLHSADLDLWTETSVLALGDALALVIEQPMRITTPCVVSDHPKFLR